MKLKTLQITCSSKNYFIIRVNAWAKQERLRDSMNSKYNEIAFLSNTWPNVCQMAQLHQMLANIWSLWCACFWCVSTDERCYYWIWLQCDSVAHSPTEAVEAVLLVIIHLIDVVCLSNRSIEVFFLLLPLLRLVLWLLVSRCHGKLAIIYFQWMRKGTGAISSIRTHHHFSLMCDSCNLLRYFKQVSKFSYRKNCWPRRVTNTLEQYILWSTSNQTVHFSYGNPLSLNECECDDDMYVFIASAVANLTIADNMPGLLDENTFSNMSRCQLKANRKCCAHRARPFRSNYSTVWMGLRRTVPMHAAHFQRNKFRKWNGKSAPMRATRIFRAINFKTNFSRLTS